MTAGNGPHAEVTATATLAGLRRGLAGHGYVMHSQVPSSETRFADGLRYRFEIPSCEGPRVFEAVLDEARERGVPVRRVSQGSGVMLLDDAELDEMARLGNAEGVEVSLFIGPRAAWEPGALAHVTAIPAGAIRGSQGLAAGMAEARRAAEHGIRSLLVADLGLLVLLATMKEAGELPSDLVLKVSALMPIANPASARTLEQLGAGTLNVVSDIPLESLYEVRAATALPLDLYVESPDDMGGLVRLYEVPELIRVGAPLYVKLGLRNAPGIYPTGLQLGDTPASMARERVRRAALCMRMIDELAPELVEGRGDERPQDLAIPKVHS